MCKYQQITNDSHNAICVGDFNFYLKNKSKYLTPCVCARINLFFLINFNYISVDVSPFITKNIEYLNFTQVLLYICHLVKMSIECENICFIKLHKHTYL